MWGLVKKGWGLIMGEIEAPESNFDKAFKITMVLEGGGKMSTNKRDPGNWTGGRVGKGVFKGTKYGIAASAHPNVDIANLTEEKAKQIYRTDYWKAASCNGYAWPLCAVMFDFAVQSGPPRALRYLDQFGSPEAILKARDAFLTGWSQEHPGNRGVEERCDRLAAMLGIKMP